MVRFICTTALCLALCVAALSSRAAQPGADVLAAAMAAVKQGNLAQAKTLLASVVANYPASYAAAEASWELGSIAAHEADRDTALTHFQWALSRFPASKAAADSLLSMAKMDRLKKPFTAVKTLERIIREYPKTGAARAARLMMAGFSNNRGERDKAAALAEEVLKDPDAPPSDKAAATVHEATAHLAIWRVRGDSAHLSQGITMLDGVMKSFPDCTKQVAQSRLLLAKYFIHTKRPVNDDSLSGSPAKGRQILQDALKNLPVNYHTWAMKVEIASSYLAERRYGDVVSECKALLAENPPMSWKTYLTYLMGDCQIRAGDKDSGISTLRQLASSYPQDDWGKQAVLRLKVVKGGLQ